MVLKVLSTTKSIASDRIDRCSAKVIVCGDGGANRLYDLGLKGEEENTCVGHQPVTPSVHGR